MAGLFAEGTALIVPEGNCRRGLAEEASRDRIPHPGGHEGEIHDDGDVGKEPDLQEETEGDMHGHEGEHDQGAEGAMEDRRKDQERSDQFQDINVIGQAGHRVLKLAKPERKRRHQVVELKGVIDRIAVRHPDRVGLQEGAEEIHRHALDKQGERCHGEIGVVGIVPFPAQGAVQRVAGAERQEHAPEHQEKCEIVLARQDEGVSVLDRKKQAPGERGHQPRAPADDQPDGYQCGKGEKQALEEGGTVRKMKGP